MKNTEREDGQAAIVHMKQGGKKQGMLISHEQGYTLVESHSSTPIHFRADAISAISYDLK